MSSGQNGKWTLVITRSPRGMHAAFRDAVEEGNKAVGLRWHDEFLPKHFTLAAYGRYGYRKREGAGQQTFFPTNGKHKIETNAKGLKYFRYQTSDGKWHTSHGELGYEARKLKKYGHQLPLVFTGQLRSAVNGSVQVTGTSRGSTVRMEGPKWLRGFLSFRGKGGTGPDMYAEMTTITKDEAEALQRTLTDVVAKRMAEVRENRSVTA